MFCLAFLRSLPLLGDLDIYSREISDNGDGSLIFPSPLLTGTLVLYLMRGIEPTTRQLFGLPNGVRSRKLEGVWFDEESLQCINNVVHGCSDTLESIDIERANPGKFHFLNFPSGPRTALPFRLRQGNRRGI